MSYTPTVWKKGDKITSEKLNKLENGVAGSGGGVFMVGATVEEGTSTLNKTWQEIMDAAKAGIVFINYNSLADDPEAPLVEQAMLYCIEYYNGEYNVAFKEPGDHKYTCSAASEYPVCIMMN